MGLWWAEAVLMAAWWLVWGGFGEAVLRHWGIARTPALVLLGMLWGAGWVHILMVPGWGPVDLGLVLVSALGVAVATVARRRSWMVAWLLLGLVAAIVRGLVPVNPDHQTFMPWLSGEATALGLLAGALAVDPVGAAAVAAAAAGLANLVRIVLHPDPGALASTDWLYTVLAVVTAWMTGWVLNLPRPVTPG